MGVVRSVVRASCVAKISRDCKSGTSKTLRVSWGRSQSQFPLKHGGGFASSEQGHGMDLGGRYRGALSSSCPEDAPKLRTTWRG